MTVIQGTATDPNGAPLKYASVSITPMSTNPLNPGAATGPPSTIRADSGGNWSLDLTPNSAGTFYQVIAGQVIASIIVPASGGPYSLSRVLATTVPAPSAPVQVAVGGTVAGVRPEVNLIAAAGATITAVDNLAANRVDVTVGATSTSTFSRQILIAANGAASSVVAPVGVWTPTYIADPAYYGWVNQSADAQNNQVSYDFACDAGVYTLELYHLAFLSRGIYTVQIDGVTAGTIDGYATGLTPTRSALTGITIGAGAHAVTLLMATKNASATGYIGQTERVALTRTA